MKRLLVFFVTPAFCSSIVTPDFVKQYPSPKESESTLVSEKHRGPRPSLELSFLCYEAGEDGLDLASSAAIITSGSSTGVVVATDNSIGLMQKSSYQPGFKVGMGATWTDWSLNADYTWIRQVTSTHRTAVATDPAVGSGVWLLNNWFQQTTSAEQTMSATKVSSKWHLGIDLADLTAYRNFNPGRHLSIDPFFGLRGAWIRQKLSLSIQVPPAAVDDLTTNPIHSHNASNSWAVGPRMGCALAGLFGKGFRVEGDFAAALLFTQYSQISHSEQVASGSETPSTLKGKLSDVNCVRPELELSLGFGWHTLLNKRKKSSLDLLLRYDFLYFWQQNMMRKLADQMVSGSGATAGDLYLEGFSLRAAFLF